MDTKSGKEELLDIEEIIAYAQLAVHTLQHSGTEINSKELQNEIKMLYSKFGTLEVKRLVSIILKQKR